MTPKLLLSSLHLRLRIVFRLRQMAMQKKLRDEFCAFDVLNAQCYDPADRQRLLSVIESGIGDLGLFNRLVQKMFGSADAWSTPMRSRLLDQIGVKAELLGTPQAMVQNAQHKKRGSVGWSRKSSLFSDIAARIDLSCESTSCKSDKSTTCGGASCGNNADHLDPLPGCVRV